MNELGYAGGQDQYAGMERPKRPNHHQGNAMTREEAKTILFNAINSAWEYESEEGSGEAMEALSLRNQALSILAPEPRTEPPVELDGNVWYSDVGDLWVLTAVDYVRKHWRDGEQWLPLSALPVPEGGA